MNKLVNKLGLLALLFLICTLEVAAEGSHGEHKHSLFGSHGMVLFADSSGQLYASHMPLYYSPHDHQIVYKVSIAPEAFNKALLEKGLVSILPANFDLSILLQGRDLEIETAVYQGHFERGGQLVQKVLMKFVEPVYRRSLAAEQKSELSRFDLVPISAKQVLFVHQIQPAPSFDLLGFIEQTGKGSSAINCPKPADISELGLQQLVKSCLQTKASYIEFKDFQRR